MATKGRSEQVVELMQALADPMRLRLLSLMRGSEICVCYFVSVLEAPQPLISRHLAYLRKKKLVAARKEGKWVHYRLRAPEDGSCKKLLEDVLNTIEGDAAVVADARRLRAACCNPAKLVGIAGAPLPSRVI